MRLPRVRNLFIGTAALAVVITSSGCSNSTSSGGGGGDSITLALSVSDPLYSVVYIAQASGYFDDAKVKVSPRQVGANVLTTVVSGQADLGAGGPAVPLPAVKNGQEISLVYGTFNANGTSFVAAPKSVKKIEDCTRFATGAVGTQTYTHANFLKNVTGAKYDVVPFGDYPTAVASLVSGSVNCAVGTYGFFAKYIESGELHLLVDPRDSNTMPPGTSASNLVVGSMWGVSSKLENKREAVVSFLRGYQRALADVRNRPASEIAALLRKIPDFAQSDEKALETQVSVLQQVKVFAPNDGIITEKAWGDSLAYFRSGGAEFHETDEPYSYAKRIDMSYLNEATRGR